MKSRRLKTVREVLDELSKDPEFVAAAKQRQALLDGREAQFRREEAPLVADLQEAGVRVESVYDLVNRGDDYPNAIPVLRAHLQRPYTPPVLEGIVRALTLKDLRGVVNGEMWTLYDNQPGQQSRWVRTAILLAFAVVGTRAADGARLQAIIADERASEDERGTARNALSKLRR